MKFDGLADQLRYHTIFGAQLQVANYDSASCRPRPVTVHPVTQAWTAGSGYAYPGPSVGAALGSASFAHGYLALGELQSAARPPWSFGPSPPLAGATACRFARRT